MAGHWIGQIFGYRVFDHSLSFSNRQIRSVTKIRRRAPQPTPYRCIVPGRRFAWLFRQGRRWAREISQGAFEYIESHIVALLCCHFN
jgi:hypothetical protein